MGKKWNGFESLLIGIILGRLDLAIGICWYTVLNPSKPEEITLTMSAVSGAVMILYTVAALFFNYVVYKEVIKD